MLRSQGSNGLIKCISHTLQWLLWLVSRLVEFNWFSGGLHIPLLPRRDPGLPGGAAGREQAPASASVALCCWKLPSSHSLCPDHTAQEVRCHQSNPARDKEGGAATHLGHQRVAC